TTSRSGACGGFCAFAMDIEVPYLQLVTAHTAGSIATVQVPTPPVHPPATIVRLLSSRFACNRRTVLVFDCQCIESANSQRLDGRTRCLPDAAQRLSIRAVSFLRPLLR